MSLAEVAARNRAAAPQVARARRVVQSAAELALDSNLPLAVRRAALRLVGMMPEQRAADERCLDVLVDPDSASDLAIAAVARRRVLGGDPQAMLRGWSRYLPSVRRVVADALASRSDWSLAFLTAVDSGQVQRGAVSADIRRRLSDSRDDAVRDMARRLFVLSVDTERHAALASVRPALELNGDPDRGRTVFAERCGTCHAIDGVGTVVGPDLRSLTDRSAASLLTAIVVPNDAVDPAHFGYTALLKTGEVVDGMIAAEAADRVTFLRADGIQRSVLRSDIETLTSSGVSFMPDGLEVGMSLRDIADLLAFLE